MMAQRMQDEFERLAWVMRDEETHPPLHRGFVRDRRDLERHFAADLIGRMADALELPDGRSEVLIRRLADVASVKPPAHYSYPTRSVFLSHAWTDGQHGAARYLRRRLARYRGVTCWLDEERILPGQHIYDRVAEALQRETDTTLCILSPEFLRSANCKVELSRSAELARGHRHRLIPVLLVDCRPPLEVAGLLYADFRSALTAHGNVVSSADLVRVVKVASDAS